jgi:hypothetical protein
MIFFFLSKSKKIDFRYSIYFEFTFYFNSCLKRFISRSTHWTRNGGCTPSISNPWTRRERSISLFAPNEYRKSWFLFQMNYSIYSFNFSCAWLFQFNIMFVFILRYNELILEKNVLMFPYSIKETSSEQMNEFSRNCFMLIDD